MDCWSIAVNNTIVYIISDVKHSKYFEWLASQWDDHFTMSFQVILINGKGGSLYEHLVQAGIPVHCVEVASRWSWRGMKAIKALLLQIQPKVVHTHLLTANILGLVAAKRAGIEMRVHTRHHSTFHHDYHPRWVRVDKWLSGLSTRVVAISKVVHDVLVDREGVTNTKILPVPHGFDLDWFQAGDEEILAMRNGWGVGDRRVVGVVSRMIDWKGVDHIVRGFKTYAKEYPDAVLIFIGTSGPDRGELINMIKEELDEDQFRLLDHVEKMNVAYRCCDCIVHVPITPEVEAFGQIYVEALASETPLICTLSGIAHEFIIDRQNALVVDYQSGKGIALALQELHSDGSLRASLISNGKAAVEPFRFSEHMAKLRGLYE